MEEDILGVVASMLEEQTALLSKQASKLRGIIASRTLEIKPIPNQPKPKNPVEVKLEQKEKRERKKHKKQEIDPLKPKIPASAYLLFSKDAMPKLKVDNPQIPQTEIMTMIGRAWKNIPEADKNRYHQLALKEKQRHERLMAEYNAIKNPIHPTEAGNKRLRSEPESDLEHEHNEHEHNEEEEEEEFPQHNESILLVTPSKLDNEEPQTEKKKKKKKHEKRKEDVQN